MDDENRSSLISNNEVDEYAPLSEILMILISNHDYLLLMLTNTGLLYVVAGLQYWTSSYMQENLNIQE